MIIQNHKLYFFRNFQTEGIAQTVLKQSAKLDRIGQLNNINIKLKSEKSKIGCVRESLKSTVRAN